MKIEEIEMITLDTDHPTVQRLMAHQGEMSDEAFCKQHLSCTGSSWGRIKAGKYYPGKDHTLMHGKLEKNLAALDDATTSQGRGATPIEILPLRPIRFALAALKKAWSEVRDRCVVILAPTGGGKSTIADFLHEQYGDKVVCCEASETWRSSYIAAIHGVLDALGEKNLPHSARLSERALVQRLKKTPKTLVIDEGHYFGPATINLVKLILNATKCHVVILAIEKLWKDMASDAWKEAEQIQSRTCDLTIHDCVAEEDIDTYFSHHLNGAWSGLNAEEKSRVTHRVALAANQFGQLNTVARIAKELNLAGGRAGIQSATKAIESVKRLKG